MQKSWTVLITLVAQNPVKICKRAAIPWLALVGLSASSPNLSRPAMLSLVPQEPEGINSLSSRLSAA